MNFDTNGAVSGWTSCNKFTAQYEEVDGKTIKIHSIAAEHNPCANPNNTQQEAQFLRALETAAVIQYDGRLLTLRTAEDAMAVVMRATP
jgi:heat shock protein HslJ